MVCHVGNPLPGLAKEDYGLLLLDRDATAAGVTPARIVTADDTDFINPSGNRLVRSLGMAGFGMRGFGDNETLVGNPGVVLEGPRDRVYVQMRTLSANTWNINAGMTAAAGDHTACGGDSGAGGKGGFRVGGGVWGLGGRVWGLGFKCR
jgi:hypothetical protein